MRTGFLLTALVVVCLIPSISLATTGGTGTIFVNANIGSAGFTIAGPDGSGLSYSGVGLTWSQANAPAGAYTITYTDVPGYTTPAAQTSTLVSGGSITFNGNYAFPGSVGAIRVITDIAGATFTLTGAGNYTGNGTLWMQINAPAGPYTITFDKIDGYPTPASQTQVLSPNGNITFIGTYSATTVTGTINVSTDLMAATFTIVGPAMYQGNGTFWSQSNAPAGSYTIVYGAVPGYTTPASQTLVLTPGGTITFAASYSSTSYSGTIIVTTNMNAATFTISGPSYFSGGGTFWSRSNCPPGTYTITFGGVSGYATPSSQTLVLTSGGAISFVGNYGGSITTGTINVNTNLVGASFYLTGPAGYAGSGMSWLQVNAPAGTYTITFSAIPGYITPVPQTQTLSGGGLITFNGFYAPIMSSTGTIIVSTDLAQATFTLSGAGSYTGNGKLWSQTNATPGTYTITFGDVSGYTTPASQTVTLTAGGTITFAGTYGPAPTTGTIIVSTNLTAASFMISGSAFYVGGGMLWSQTGCPPGTYTITFNPVPGYPTPSPQTLVVQAGGTITFVANYGIGSGGGTIQVNANLAGATFWLTGPLNYSGSGLWWTQTNAPAGMYIITFGDIAGYKTPATQALVLSAGGTITFTGIYTSLSPFTFTVLPSSLTFTYDTGKTIPAAQQLTVSPEGLPVTVNAYVSTGGSWLSVTPNSTTAPGVLTVAVSPAGLPTGIYTGSIVITGGADYRAFTVPVTLNVREIPKLILTPTSLSFSYLVKGAWPAAQDFWISASPRNVSYTLGGSAGTWLAVSTTGNTPAKLSIGVDPSNLAPGTYTGSIIVTSPEASNSPQTVPVTLVVTASAPSLAGAAVLNAASGDPRIAPCSIASIYGSNLALSAESAQVVPLPTTLAKTRVNINGQPTPLFYVSPGQINFQVPCGVAPGTAQVEVNNGYSSGYTAVQVSATAPGAFLYESKWAAANNQDGSTHGDDNPAAAGSVMAVYFTGQGLLDSWIQEGVPAPMDHLMRPVASVTATLAGRSVEILFAGLTPGAVGLAQVNLRVPADLAAGQYPLVLSVGGVQSNVAVVCVKTR